MLRTLILTLAGGFVLTATTTAQECSGCKSSCDSATVATTVSQDEPSALAKGLAALAKKPFSFDMKMSIKDGENGGTVDGKVAFGDSKHFALNVNIAMKEGETSQNAKIRLVADGTWLYYHVDSPELPAEAAAMAIGKVKLSVFDQIAQGAMAQSPLPILDEKGNINASTIDKALSQAGLKITRDDEKGIVNLSMDVPGEGETPGKMVVTLNGKNYLPKSIKVNAGEGQGMTATFSNGKVLKEMKEFGEGAWKFTVPEGTIINDMTAMLQMAMAQMMPQGGGEEDELEF
jgi:hypothetical protein